MGLYTPNAQVWYPTTSDTAEINTLLATQASSIEDGLGARMVKQEATKSAVANLTASQTFVNGTGQSVNYTISSLGYNDGMTLTSGKFIIDTAGLYFFSFGGFVLSTTNTSGGSARFQLRKNGAIFGAGLARISADGGTASGTCSGSGVTKCAAGDTIDVWVLFGSTTGTITVNAAQPEYNIFTGALIKAF